jgi:hypothetical protein
LVVRRLVAFGDWSHSEIGRILGNSRIGRSENGRSEIGRSVNGRSVNGRSEIGRCTNLTLDILLNLQENFYQCTNFGARCKLEPNELQRLGIFY